MLTLQEQEFLAGVLAEQFVFNDARAWMAAVIPTKVLAAVPIGPTPAIQARMLLRTLVEDDWRHDPPLLVRMLDALPPTPRAREIRDRIVQKRSPLIDAPDPFESVILHDRLPFIARHELRQRLRMLERPGSRIVLVVNGPPRSGKSYTAQLIRHVSSTTGWFEVAYCNSAWATTVDEIAMWLVGELGQPLESMPQRRSGDLRWTRILSQFVRAQIAQTKRLWWLVLDEFGAASVAPETREFIIALVHDLQYPRTERCRLVLIDFDAPLGISTHNLLTQLIEPLTQREIVEGAKAIAVSPWERRPK